jgi:DNA invertase Pin-like site-specific DNA recombinase
MGDFQQVTARRRKRGKRLAILYLRLSDARIEEALSGREERLRKFAAARGYEVYRVIRENDHTKGQAAVDGSLPPASAFKRKKIRTPDGKIKLRVIRPGFRSMLDDLVAGRAHVVIVEDLDRLLRQPRDNEDLLDAVELAGATVLSLSGSITLTNGGTETERFTARVMAAAANKSSADTARRVKAMRARMTGKSYLGGRRWYGYEPDPDAPKYRKKLLVVEEEAKNLRLWADGILNHGVSVESIVRDLRERDVPTLDGKIWRAQNVRAVLTKPAVAGLTPAPLDDDEYEDDGDPDYDESEEGEEIARPRILLEAPWPAILERDTWERLREWFGDPSHKTSTGNEPRRLISHLAVCGVCGRKIVSGGGGGAPGSGGRYRTRDCKHLTRNAGSPDNLTGPVRGVDDLIARLVVAVLDRDNDGELLKPPVRPGVDVPALNAEKKKLRARKTSQARLHANGAIDDAQLAAGSKEIQEQLDNIERQLTAADESDPLEDFRGKPAATVWLAKSVRERRQIVRLLFESIILHPTSRRGPGIDVDAIEVIPREEVEPYMPPGQVPGDSRRRPDSGEDSASTQPSSSLREDGAQFLPLPVRERRHLREVPGDPGVGRRLRVSCKSGPLAWPCLRRDTLPGGLSALPRSGPGGPDGIAWTGLRCWARALRLRCLADRCHALRECGNIRRWLNRGRAT